MTTHLGAQLSAALSALQGANRPWLAVALAGYYAAYLTMCCAWRVALRTGGSCLGLRDVVARLAIGSVVNMFTPARIGDAVKVALLSESLAGTDRVWTAGGLYAAVAASRAFSIAALVLVASATGALPLWPAVVLTVGATALALAGLMSPRLRRWRRVAHLLSGVAALSKSPRQAGALVAWSTGTTVARLLGTTALAAALGVPHPLLAGLLIVTALDAAGAIPLTPGGVGVTSGAVAVALASRGIGMSQAVGVGIAVQALETLVTLGVGSFGLLHLAGRTRVRPWLYRAAAVTASGAAAAGGAFAFGLLSA